MRVKKYTLSSLFAVFLFTISVTACGDFFVYYDYEKKSVMERNYFDTYSTNYLNMDENSQIIPTELNIVELFPLYRKMTGRPLSSEQKKHLFQNQYLELPEKNSEDVDYYTCYSKEECLYAGDYEKKLITEHKKYSEAINKWNRIGDNNSLNKENFTFDYSEKNSDGYVALPDIKDCPYEKYDTLLKLYDSRKKVLTKQDLKTWYKNEDELLSLCKDFRTPGYILPQEILVYKDEPGQGPVTATTTTATTSIVSTDRNFLEMIASFIRKLFDDKYTNTMATTTYIYTVNTYEPKDFQICEKDFINTCDLEIKYSGLMQQDYEYSQGAKAFYSGETQRAERIFKYILNNMNHSRYAESKFNLAIIYLRKLDTQDAKKYFDEILTDNRMRDYHNQVYEILIGYDLYDIEKELMFSNQLKYLEQILPTASYTGSSPFYTYLDNKYDIYSLHNLSYYQDDAEELEKYTKENLEIINKIRKQWGEMQDITKFYFAWRFGGGSNIDLYKSEYKKTGQDNWLLTIIRYLPPSDPEFNFYRDKVLAIPENNLIYYTANLFLIEKYIKENNFTEARNLLSRFSNIDKRLGISLKGNHNAVYDVFSDLKMKSSLDLLEYFKNSNRYPYSSFGYYPTKKDLSDSLKFPLIAHDARATFLNLDLQTQTDIIGNNSIFLNPKILEHLRFIVLVKSLLLKNYEVAEKVANLMISANPNIKNRFTDFLQAKTAKEKEYAAVAILLRNDLVGFEIEDDFFILANKGMRDYGSYEKNIEYGLTNYENSEGLLWYGWEYCPERIVTEGKEARLISKTITEKFETENAQIKKYATHKNFGDIVFGYAKSNSGSNSLALSMHNLVAIGAIDLENKACLKQNIGTSISAYNYLKTKFPDLEITKKISAVSIVNSEIINLIKTGADKFKWEWNEKEN